MNTPRAIAPALQRAGRAGHWRGATPKARFFATTRDDLLELGAVIRAINAQARSISSKSRRSRSMSSCSRSSPPAPPSLGRKTTCSRSSPAPTPIAISPRETFEELLCLLSDGIESSRGRYGAYILRDRIHGRLQARRGARSITVSNGGTIPDTAVVSVILQPDGHQIATLDEDFTIDSGVGDVIQLGNASWRISAIETAGRMYVEDAHGQPPYRALLAWRGAPAHRGALALGLPVA